MVFSDEDRVVIQFLRQTKNYSSKVFLKEFPDKNWSRSGLDRLLKNIDSSGSAERRMKSGRPRSARIATAIEQVEGLVLSQEYNPQTRFSQREIAKKLEISKSSVYRILKRDLKAATQLVNQNASRKSTKKMATPIRPDRRSLQETPKKKSGVAGPARSDRKSVNEQVLSKQTTVSEPIRPDRRPLSTTCVFQDGQTYQIRSCFDGSFLDLHNGSTANENFVKTFTAHGGDSQRWTASKEGTGFRLACAFQEMGTLRCLDQKLEDTGRVHFYNFHGGLNQQWYTQSLGNDIVVIRNCHNHKALTHQGLNKPVKCINTDKNDIYQKWSVISGVNAFVTPWSEPY